MSSVLSRLRLILMAALLLWCGGCFHSRTSSPTGRTITLTHNGTWTWFNDPRAVYDPRTNRVYTGWISNTGTIQFAAHDLKSGKTTALNLKTGFEADDHNNPAFLLHDDGTITAFYTAHRTEYPERAVLWRRIVPPLQQTKDGYALGPEQRIMRDDDVQGEKKNTYANPFHLANDGGRPRTYLFSRGANFNPVYRIHDDGADPNAWSAAKNFILNAPNRPYLKYDSNNLDRVSFLFTDANPGSARNNVYFMYLKDGMLHNADGSVIRKLSDGPIAPSDAGKVFDHLANPAVTDDNSWVWDLATDPRTGHPIATFVSFRGIEHFYHYAWFDGHQWIDHLLDVVTGDSIEGKGLGDNYSGGLVLDHTDPSIMYLSHVVDGHYALDQWKTRDGGATWTKKRIATEGSKKILRPFVPLNRPADTEMVVWLSGDYSSWDATLNGGFHTSVRLWTAESRGH